jgi:thiol:disulfide interchange protein DsbA
MELMNNRLISFVFTCIAGVVSVDNVCAQAPVAGEDYVVIPDGQPFKAPEDKIVVEEVFNYGLPGCYQAQSQFSAWAAKLSSDVEVAYLPLPIAYSVPKHRLVGEYVVAPGSDLYERAFYAAQSYDLIDEAHEELYEAIHKANSLPAIPGPAPDKERLAAFFSAYGVDTQQFLKKLSSFGVEAKIQRAKKMRRVFKAPSIIVNGRYAILPHSERTYADMLATASYLVDKERERLE